MIYVESWPTIFLVKEDLSDYVICRGDHEGYSFQLREYQIYDDEFLQEAIAPKALAWWTE